MTSDDNDLTLQALQRLAVLEPDPARSDRVRMRCRAAIGQHEDRRVVASGRLTGLILQPGLMYGLSVGYLAAMIHDLLRVYLRR